MSNQKTQKLKNNLGFLFVNMFIFYNHYVLTTDPLCNIVSIILGSLNSSNKPNTTDSVTQLMDYSWFHKSTSLCPNS